MDSPQPEMRLDTPARFLKGVGPVLSEKLETLEIRTLGDLVFQTPRAWEDRRPLERGPLKDASKPFALRCRVNSTHQQTNPFGRFSTFTAEASTENPYLPQIRLLWIRRKSPYDVYAKLRRELIAGRRLLAYGRMEILHGRSKTAAIPAFHVSDYKTLETGFNPTDSPHWMRLAPVYHATEGLSQRQLRQWRWEAIRLWGTEGAFTPWPEAWRPDLPEGLINLGPAYVAIHFPRDNAILDRARKTIAFWEILSQAVAMELRRRRMIAIRKRHHYDEILSSDAIRRFMGILPFTLTAGQNQALNEIVNDMSRPCPMNRLLQGEVGSGKTVVALLAACRAAASGHQTAFIAPTEILAAQHLDNFRRFLEPMGFQPAGLTSESSAGERASALRGFKDGSITIAVGTHSLLEPEVSFASLALIIIDEQHRFGVRQRWTIRNKARRPDCLILSATPIPRTLALALYGDLEISTMEELPRGRKLASARLLADENEAWILAREAVRRKERVYVVVPVIEESARLFSVERQFERLRRLFPEANPCFLHGRMKRREKEAALAGFRRGDSQMMISTSVIEVGIDVPEASLMVMLNADRFGLASLHQLRGRVGRGDVPGVCLLVPSATTQASEPNGALPLLTGEANRSRERLERFCGARSGFEIGELDFDWRGPGDLLGWAQHGAGEDLSHVKWKTDITLIPVCRGLAGRILDQDPNLARNDSLRRMIERRFGRDFFSSDIS